MQSEPQRVRGMHLQAEDVGSLTCSIPPVTHTHTHTQHLGAICFHGGFAFSLSRTDPRSQGSCSGLEGSQGYGAFATLGTDYHCSCAMMGLGGENSPLVTKGSQVPQFLEPSVRVYLLTPYLPARHCSGLLATEAMSQSVRTMGREAPGMGLRSQ